MKNQTYSINLNSSLEIPELGLHFNFHAIAPEGSKNGAWPYCLSYQISGLDAFGLAHFGSNIRIEDPSTVNEVLNDLVTKYGEQSRRAIEISKLGSREPSVGLKYKVVFHSPGLIHRGTYFESFRDIESFIKTMSIYGDEVEARVFHSTTRESLGKYVRNKDSTEFRKTLKKGSV